MTARAMEGSGRRIGALVFAVCWVGYLAGGIYLAYDQQFFFGDALSRVQAAQSVLFSRDPHLAAIGFIFTPLTALVQLPLIALSPVFPALTADALSAVIMSSAFMAGSVAGLAGIARDRQVPAWLAATALVAYAANPMIVLYAASGMSEAPALFFIVWATRRLMRWVDTDDVHDLLTAAIALALGFLTRYEFLIGTAAAAVVVSVVTYRRPDPVRRYGRAVLDATLVLLPTVGAFAVWSVTSWIISGELLAQFTSEYGNAAIIADSGGSGSSGVGEALRFSITEMLVLAPLLPLLIAVVAVVRYRRRRLYPLVAAIAIGTGMLLFQTLAYARGTTFGFLRFYLAVVPISAMVALLAVPAQRIVPWRRLGHDAQLPELSPPGTHRLRNAASGVLAAVTVLVAVPVTAAGMTSPVLAPQEFAIRTIVAPQPDSVNRVYLDARRVARSFSTERALADYLDSLHLPDGAVLTDTVYGFAVVVRSKNPRQFVIPSDQDFAQILNDPESFGVRYLLSVPNTGRGRADALNLRYPTLYENGADISSLYLEAPNQGADLPDWRIYRVLPGSMSVP